MAAVVTLNAVKALGEFHQFRSSLKLLLSASIDFFIYAALAAIVPRCGVNCLIRFIFDDCVVKYNLKGLDPCLTFFFNRMIKK